MATATDTRVEIAGVSVSTDHFIDGGRTASAERFEDLSPIDQQVLAEVSRGSEEEVDRTHYFLTARQLGLVASVAFAALRSAAQRAASRCVRAPHTTRRFAQQLAAETDRRTLTANFAIHQPRGSAASRALAAVAAEAAATAAAASSSQQWQQQQPAVAAALVYGQYSRCDRLVSWRTCNKNDQQQTGFREEWLESGEGRERGRVAGGRGKVERWDCGARVRGEG